MIELLHVLLVVEWHSFSAHSHHAACFHLKWCKGSCAHTYADMAPHYRCRTKFWQLIHVDVVDLHMVGRQGV